MMMNSLLRKSRRLPTGGFNSSRCWAIQRARLNGASGFISRMVRRSEWGAQLVKIRSLKNGVWLSLALVSLCELAGCHTLKSVHVPKVHWPWAAKPAPVEPAANQIAWEGIDGATAREFPQSWARNTLMIDLTGASDGGGVRMHAKASMGWPKAMALRLRPGSVSSVEIQADQRVVIPVVGSGSATVTIPIAPSVYSAHTETITLLWSTTP